MCVKNTEEGCILAASQEELKNDVAALDTRLTMVEADVSKMRSETQEAFRALSAAVDNLAHDFGQRMNNFDARIVAEKERWGDTVRDIVRWTVRVILAGCAVAMGITAWQSLVK